MNEQEETELQVLQSIWEDDFTVKEPRLYRAILRPDEHITLALEFDCRNTDYPNTIPSIKVRLIKGNIIPIYKEYLERTLTDSANEKLGLPMMYDLIERAKQEIEVNDLTQGSIGILVPDTLMQIFECLDYRNLTCCGCVNKKWMSLTSGDRLWKNILTDLEFVSTTENLPPIEKSDEMSNRDYFTILRKAVLKHLFYKHPHVLSIHSDPTNSVDFPMTPVNFNKSVIMAFSPNYSGHMRICPQEKLSLEKLEWTFLRESITFYTVAQAERLFSSSPWFYRAMNWHNELKCPYVGPVVGFVAINMKRKEDLMKLFFRSSRGIVANISLPNYSQCTVIKSVEKYEIDASLNVHFLPSPGRDTLVDNLNKHTKLCNDLRRVLKEHRGSTLVTPADFWHIDETIMSSAKMSLGAAAESSFEEFAKDLIQSNPNVRKPIEKPVIYK